jgi:hypothetical protein
LSLVLAGSAPIPGTLAVSLPVLGLLSAGRTPPPRKGFGLVLDSTATVTVEAPLSADTSTVPLHVVTPTVPVPTLVDGRPS